MINVSLIKDLDPQAKNLEGYLFPDTYEFSPETTAPELIEMMVKSDEEDVRWRRWIWFEVGFDVPPARVLAAANQALANAAIDNVLAEPVPSCVLMEFGESGCRYALRKTTEGLDGLCVQPGDPSWRLPFFAAWPAWPTRSPRPGCSAGGN
jgi:hypothetical protein